MAQRGRKAQPKTVIQPGPMPSPPEWLAGENALAMWHKYGPTLNALGLLESLDAIAFAMLCDSLDALLKQREKLDGVPLVVMVGENGAEQQHPLVGIVRQQFKAVQSLLAEFGLTPSSRTALTGSTSVKPIEAAVDPLEALMEQMGTIGDAIPDESPQPITPRKRKAAKKRAARKTTPKKRAAKKRPARKKTAGKRATRKADK